MKTLLALLAVVLVDAVNCEAYRYYYTRPSYRSLFSKIENLERKVNSLQQPIHIHLSGNEDQAALSADGTHVHVHLSLDGKKGVEAAGLEEKYSYAVCNVEINHLFSTILGVRGTVHMRQKPSSQIEIKVALHGFAHSGLFGFHVHEAADFRRGCSTFGGHYNPYGKYHGGPTDEERHVGDWGNLSVGADGKVNTTITDRLASLFGQYSIVGRGIVVHAGTDDLGRGGDVGSRTTGNAGTRLSCCSIQWSNGEGW